MRATPSFSDTAPMESNPTLPLFVVGTFRSSSKDGTCPATEALLTLLRFRTGLIAVPVVKLDAPYEAISCMKHSVLFGPRYRILLLPYGMTTM